MEHCVVVKKVVHADRERVFDAWTKPEMMQHWFVGAKGTAKTNVDLRVGGTYSNEMLLSGCGDASPGDTGPVKSYMHDGEYLEIVRPERLVFTWNSPSVRNTKVTVELREVAVPTPCVSTVLVTEYLHLTNTSLIRQ